MKATGIVRRIDDLGRLVIPKEIRRTFHIKEGDSMEIFTNREGEIVLKKYSPIGEMGSFAKQYAESLAQVTGHTALIADRDIFIAVSGTVKGAAGKEISKELEEKMNQRDLVFAKKKDSAFIPMWEGMPDEVEALVAAPIVASGDVVGVVAIVSGSGKEGIAEVEKKLVMTAAGFLGKQLEQ